MSFSGLMSMLDAATDDLAMLINHLDMDGTPSSMPNVTPMSEEKAHTNGDGLPSKIRTASQESPIKNNGHPSHLSLRSDRIHNVEGRSLCRVPRRRLHLFRI
jgi:serine/arginine repetitive matrix protein 2